MTCCLNRILSKTLVVILFREQNHLCNLVEGIIRNISMKLM